jgi:DNA-binding transcriptional ArsR family regulator
MPDKTAPSANERAVMAPEMIAAMCKALGHPARIAILRHLLEQDHCICGRIVDILPLAQSTVSQHLKILKQCGLIRGEVAGTRSCYCVDRQRLAQVMDTMNSLFNVSADRRKHEQSDAA